jgi:hypothetical protein
MIVMKMVLFFLFVLSPVTVCAFTGDATVDGIRYYIITEAQVATVIPKKGGYEGKVVIPSQINYDGVICKVTEIGYDAFSNCKRLLSVTIPNSVIRIGSYAFQNCSGLTSIILPRSMLRIGVGAFYGCSNLGSVNFPKNITTIFYRVFEGCRKLSDVRIPSNVKEVCAHAFEGCSSLTMVCIPKSVKYVNNGAFAYCGSLRDVYCYAESVPGKNETAGLEPDSPFIGSHIENATLHVPAGSIEKYKKDHIWGNFKKVVAIGIEIEK